MSMKITTNKLLKVIHQHCLNCMGGQKQEVPLCTDRQCKLYPFRMGEPDLPTPNNAKIDLKIDAINKFK